MTEDGRFDPLAEAKRLEALGDLSGVQACLRLARDQGGDAGAIEMIQARLDDHVSRRRLLLAATGVVGFALVGSWIGSGVLFLHPPKNALIPEKTVRLGREDDFKANTARRFEIGGKTIILIRDAMGRFHALSAVCTHSDVCLVEWEGETQELVCPCHKAMFDVRGNVLEGPPPRPLPLYPVRVVQGAVFVKLG